MTKLKLYIPLLLGCLLAGCTDDLLDHGAEPDGTYSYRFAASIETDEEALQTRISFDSDGYDGLKMHWEAGDVIVLRDTVIDKKYEFTATEYLWNKQTNALTLKTEGTAASADETSVFFFEYHGTEPIQNASCFNGIARSLNFGRDWDKATTQLKNDDPSHLKYCEELSAHLKDVDLTRPASAWMPDNLKLKIPFYHSGRGAYLKIITKGYKYPIWNRSTVSIYILDESKTNYEEYFEPISTIHLGSATNGPSTSDVTNSYSCKNYVKNSNDAFTGAYNMYNTTYSMSYPDEGQTPFIDVPTYLKRNTNTLEVDDNRVKADFDDISQHYIGDEPTGVFYVPVPTTAIPQGNYMYIATVVQDSWSGDIYVWEKKVPFETTLHNGKLYTLDYSDRTPDYALEIVKGLTYFRNRYLEQDEEGITAKAPRYTMLGEKVEESDIGQYAKTIPNKMTGLNGFDWQDVLSMRYNHGAFYVSTSPMVSIGPRKSWHWKWTSSPDVTNSTNTNYPKFNTSVLDGKDATGAYTDLNIERTRSYMSKITKGYISWEAKYTLGIVSASTNSFSGGENCTEYVLRDEYDPVMQSRKTSSLWRTPYGVDLYALSYSGITNGVTSYAAYTSVDREEGYCLIESGKSGHRLCLPYLPPYSESGQSRGTSLDGSESKQGKWAKSADNYANYRFLYSRCVRSFGASNSAFMQSPCMGFSDNGQLVQIQQFGVASAILPVFRCKVTVENNAVVKW